MNRRNYQKEMEKIIDGFSRNNGGQPEAEETYVPSLFLHSCCAPCSSYVLEYLSEYFRIHVFYYNPNISPQSEYDYRVSEVERLVREIPAKHKITCEAGEYHPEEFFERVKGHEMDKEGGERCTICFEMRLEEAARRAAEGGYDYFTTSLTISPLKDADRLNAIGERMGEKYGVKCLPSDFKKKNGYKRSTELSAIYGLYRQNYCGCVFSKRDAISEEEIERKASEGECND